ncbi:MAG: class I SAM-dependent methyltransferase, partial [Proteobacteria bacterium]|nr:class I SAM-dependent methyltransferase [Pseudomonadota bacterium]
MPDDDFSDYETLDVNQRIAPIAFQGMCFDVVDREKYNKGLALIKESLHPAIQPTLYSADNLITWNKNLSFFRDDYFINFVNDQSNLLVEQSIIWRTYILLYFASKCCTLEGDFIELGCHTGGTAQHIVDRIDFKANAKKLFLYDLFEWNEGDQHTRHTGHANENMHGDLVARFSGQDFVRIIKGFVPDSFAEALPEKIAFAHIDMNHPTPEVGPLKHLRQVDRDDGVVILDDYG